MKLLKRTYHFLGGITFAIILIATAAITVIIGTFLESWTGSHRYAALLTYHHPFLILLLWGFFINILISALRRWPFKRKHIPFLITHFGLLMILSGTLAKSYFGVQGNMLVVEGSGSETVWLPETYVVRIDNRKGETFFFPVKQGEIHINNAAITVVEYYPHSKEVLQSWIKGNGGQIIGLNIFPTQSNKDSLTVSAKARFSDDDEPWNIYALQDRDPDTVALPEDSPSLAFVEDADFSMHILYRPRGGTLQRIDFPASSPLPLFIYDEGFGGYATQLELPAADSYRTRKQILIDTLDSAANEAIPLSPPLQLLADSCQHLSKDFGPTAVAFLGDWELQNRWVYDPNKISDDAVERIDWSNVPDPTLNAIRWTALLLNEVENERIDGATVIEILQSKHWPYSDELDESTALETITKRLMMTEEHLPPFYAVPPKTWNATLLSAWMRAHGITLSAILPPFSEEPKTTIETTVTTRQYPLAPLKKLEENRPLVILEVNEEGRKQQLGLSYNPQGSGLFWPFLNGRYRARFEPERKKLPYHVRLRDARQINYSGTSQPFSYEADIYVTDNRTSEEKRVTLSMNHVHETWDGYRFYLANITPGDETSVGKVHIVVNHDPAKYLLTYPGGVILAIGICLLFFSRSSSRRHRQNR